jgi:hypothetical protein
MERRPGHGRAVARVTAAVSGSGGSARAFVVAAGGAVVLAWVLSLPVDPTPFWFAACWVVWSAGTLWVLLAPRPSLAVAGVQVWFLLAVLAPAGYAFAEGRTTIGGVDFTPGTASALRLSALALAALLAGAVVARLWCPPTRVRRVRVELPSRRLDRWAVGFLLAGLGAFALFVVLARGDLRGLLVLVGDRRYGAFLRASEGTVLKYLQVLLSLAGVGLVVAVLRLTASRRRPALPLAVIAVATLALISGGARWYLAVPAVAAVLLWWKTTASGWVRRPRRIVFAGAVALVVVAVLVGGLRDQVGPKSVDPGAFVEKELRGGVFAATAGLTQHVPSTRDHLWGASYAEILTMPVPRALWPGKPEGATKELQAGWFPQLIGASYPFYGELYANFGLAGAVLGGFGFGAVLEYAWLRLVGTRRLTVAVTAAAAVPVLLQILTRGSLAGQLASQFGFVVGVLALVHLIGRARRRTRSPAPVHPPAPAQPPAPLARTSS